MQTKYSRQEHLARADHNRALVGDLNHLPGRYEDWQVTSLFYAAVHLVQAYFSAKTNHYPGSHEAREELVRQDSKLRTIYRDYRELKHLSISSRYTCTAITARDVSAADARLRAIQAHIQQLL